MTTDMLELIAKVRGTYEGPVNVWDIRNATADALEALEQENAELRCTIAKYQTIQHYKEARRTQVKVLQEQRDALAEQNKVLLDAVKANHDWHCKRKPIDGYGISDLCEMNLAALATGGK